MAKKQVKRGQAQQGSKVSRKAAKPQAAGVQAQGQGAAGEVAAGRVGAGRAGAGEAAAGRAGAAVGKRAAAGQATAASQATATSQSSSPNMLIVLTRVPVAGETKTRMIPNFVPNECAEFHTAMLQDLAEVCAQLPQDVQVRVLGTPAECVDDLKPLFSVASGAANATVSGGATGTAVGGAAGSELASGAAAATASPSGAAPASAVQFGPQAKGSLGLRMAAAIRDALQAGAQRVVLVGSDSPELPASYIQDAFAALDNADVVLGATEDGGYYLVGMNANHGQIFDIEGFGGPNVFERTLAAAKQAGLYCAQLPVVQDMDTLFDLQCLWQRKNTAPVHTAAALDSLVEQGIPANRTPISIIIPLYNEVRTIDVLINQLRYLAREAEIILVDGGSTDGTYEELESLVAATGAYNLLQTAKSRGHQQNAGAAIANGDILFFLHADSLLPADPLGEIRAALEGGPWGCFGIEFPSKSLPMKTCQAWSNARAKWRHTPYGDQGIFLTRQLFNEVGGFPDIPLMEDYQLSLTLRERGLKPQMTKHHLGTSARRFPKTTTGQVKMMFKMANLRKRYRQGAKPEDLDREYEDAR